MPAAQNAQGPAAKYISFKSAACRCFGFLVSKKKYVYTIDDDCFVATDPLSKEPINVMAGHLRNLLTPSTPYFFNTMRAPLRPPLFSRFCLLYPHRTGFLLLQYRSLCRLHFRPMNSPLADAPGC